MAALSEGIRVNELARQMGIPRSSASALVATLEGRGYIQATADGYRLAEIYRDSGWVGGGTSALLRVGQAVMGPLVAETGESAFLGIPTPALEVRYIAKKVSANPLRYDVGLEFLRPAYCTSIGQVILSGLDDAGLDEYLGTHPLTASTPRTVTDPDAIRAAIARGKSQGYVTIADSNVLGASGVAAPVRASGRIVAGLAVIAPSARFDAAREHIIEAVVRAAREITARLAQARPAGSGADECA